MSSVIDLSSYLAADETKLNPIQLGFDPQTMMREVVYNITLSQPFFSTFLYSYPIVLLEPDHPVVPTAATDGVNLYFNVLFMRALYDETNQGNGTTQQQFVIMHEIMHLVLDSFERRGSRDNNKWNSATDYVINAILLDFGIPLPNIKVFNKAIKRVLEHRDEYIQKVASEMASKTGFNPENGIISLYSEKYKGMTAEQIYDLLDDELDDNGNGDGGGGFDVHLGEEFKPQSSDDKAKIKASARSTVMAGVKAHEQKSRNSDRGDLPATLKFLINEIKKPRIPWSSMIQAELNDMAPDEYDDSIFDARYFSSGFTLAGMEPEKFCRIGFITDTSGSMSDDDLKKALSEIYGITQEFDRYVIDVITMDTQPYNHKTYTQDDGDNILKYEFSGRGGTYFEPAMKFMQEVQADSEPFDALIFFTDGFGEGWCEKYRNVFRKVIWLITSTPGAADPTWGSVIHYDKYDVG